MKWNEMKWKEKKMKSQHHILFQLSGCVINIKDVAQDRQSLLEFLKIVPISLY